MKRIVLLAFLFALPAFGQLNSNTLTIRFAGAPTGPCSPFMYAVNNANGDFYDCKASVWFKVSGGGGSGTVTSVATTSPITGGTITGTGTIACATCTTSTSPGAGVAHFAGSTQDMTSSLIVAADIASTVSLPQVKTISGSNTSITATSGAPATIFSFTIPSLAGAQNYAINCAFNYFQATPSAGDGYAIGVTTNNPTRLALQTIVWTSQAGANATNIQTTTTTGYANTTVFTPGAAINLSSILTGSLEEPANTANTLNIGGFTGNGSNAFQIVRGSWCSVTPGS